MVTEKKQSLQCWNHRAAGFAIFNVVLNVAVICCLSYGWVTQNYINNSLRGEIDSLKQSCTLLTPGGTKTGQMSTSGQEEKRTKREIISSDSDQLKSLLRGPPGVTGPPGAPGKDGTDGRDGKGFTLLDLLRDIINETVTKEWTQLSMSLPTYGGATFIRWGRLACPDSSAMIYKGQMAGPDYLSSGGGSNYQCLPEDPEYSSYRVPATKSSLRTVVYIESPNIEGKSLSYLRVPCVACETKQRMTLIMIPGKTRCPSSSWNLEYRGYVMSEAEHDSNNSASFQIAKNRGRGNYICVDERSEPASSTRSRAHGAVLHTVEALCFGDDAVLGCPPYKSDQSALSCVVCSK